MQLIPRADNGRTLAEREFRSHCTTGFRFGHAPESIPATRVPLAPEIFVTPIWWGIRAAPHPGLIFHAARHPRRYPIEPHRESGRHLWTWDEGSTAAHDSVVGRKRQRMGLSRAIWLPSPRRAPRRDASARILSKQPGRITDASVSDSASLILDDIERRSCKEKSPWSTKTA
jgi:hypothetical protein